MTMRWLVIFFIATNLAVPTVVATEGAEIYTDFCESCHAADAAGLNTFDGSLDAFQAILEGESEDMPDFFGVFDDAEIATLYRYVTK